MFWEEYKGVVVAASWAAGLAPPLPVDGVVVGFVDGTAGFVAAGVPADGAGVLLLMAARAAQLALGFEEA